MKQNDGEQTHISENKLRRGIITHKIPVIIDSRTTVYIAPGKDIDKVREKYKSHLSRLRWVDSSGNVIIR